MEGKEIDERNLAHGAVTERDPFLYFYCNDSNSCPSLGPGARISARQSTTCLSYEYYDLTRGASMKIVSGVDVSKDHLEYTYTNAPEVWRYANSQSGCLKLIKQLKKAAVTLVIVEYQQRLCRLLWAAQIPVAVVNPRWVRSFAQSLGQRAKNDILDAKILMTYGERNNPRVTEPVSPLIQKLREYLTRRQQLNEMLVMEKNHAAAPEVSIEMKRSIRKLMATIRTQIQAVDSLICSAIESEPEIHHKAQKLRSQTGVGPVLMTTLIADVPELGSVRRNVASALLGVAPFDDDSGNHSGKRQIAGGRVRARNALYMATLAAIRHDEHLKNFYRRLLIRKKPRKVAIVACMRKFIIHLNAILRQHPENHFMAT
jgi:transposase